MKILESYYLSNNLEYVIELTELSLDELESIVGRFKNHYAHGNSIKGECVVDFDGIVYLRHHFTKKILWSNT